MPRNHIIVRMLLRPCKGQTRPGAKGFEGRINFAAYIVASMRSTVDEGNDRHTWDNVKMVHRCDVDDETCTLRRRKGSAMEFETTCRYDLNAIVSRWNNWNGQRSGGERTRGVQQPGFH